jgi:peptidoglycan DL-endopeptidase CwlO
LRKPTTGYRAIATVLLAALVFPPAVAFGATSGKISSPINAISADNTATPAPVVPPKTTPTTPTTKTTTKKSSSGSSSSSADNSAITTPEDAKTTAFKAELAKRQARLDALQAQLDGLDRELEIATENYNAAVEKLDTTNKRLGVSESDLKNAQAAYEVQSKLLEARIRIMYRGSDLETIQMLLEAKSVSDFVQRVNFLTTMGQEDADLAVTLANQRDSVQQTLVDLKDSKLEAQQLEFSLKARRIEIQLRITERQQMLASAQGDLASLLGQAQANRAANESALMQQILAGASSVGITVEPGSPAETALAYHGIPYVWAGADPSGFDCSGLMLYVFAQHGVTLPHYSGAQFQLGQPVAPADLQSGDAVFFGSPIHHVGMYLGNGYFIEAPHTGSFVRVSKLSDRSDYAGARRYPWVKRTAPIMGVTTPASQPNVTITH